MTGNELKCLSNLGVYFTQLAAFDCMMKNWSGFGFTLINFSGPVCHFWQVLALCKKNNISNSQPKLWDNLWGVECHHLLRTCLVEVITARGGRAQLQLSREGHGLLHRNLGGPWSDFRGSVGDRWEHFGWHYPLLIVAHIHSLKCWSDLLTQTNN